jgi:hypothetical protein
MATRWISGFAGGLFIALAVFFLLTLALGRIFEGLQPWDTVVGFVLPVLLGLLAGFHSFKRSVWPQ